MKTESSVFYENILKNCRGYFHRIVDERVDWWPSGPLEIRILNKDGYTYEYHEGLRSVRRIQANDGSQRIFKNEFSARLMYRMADQGFTQAKLSEVSEVSQKDISNYLCKKSIPSSLTILRLAIALDCKVSDLIDS